MKVRAPDAESVKQTVLETRRRLPLRRSRDDRMLLGVCGGIARSLNIDPAIVRILWALFSIGSLGTGVILYIIAAILMPEEDPGAEIEAVEGEVLDPVQPQNSN
ncbi:MAG: PspC domain-containing protein [Chloroflexi bacterium]|nr:PspC domain-containing protein [Chloroflexota bacterium]